MKVFNVWQCYIDNVSPTGPWVYVGQVRGSTEDEALTAARYKYGLMGIFRVYEGL